MNFIIFSYIKKGLQCVIPEVTSHRKRKLKFVCSEMLPGFYCNIFYISFVPFASQIVIATAVLQFLTKSSQEREREIATDYRLGRNNDGL